MIKRIMIFGILASLLQVVIYYFLIFIFWNIEKIFHTPEDSDFTTGLAVITSIILFSAIICIQNFLIEIFNKNLFTTFIFSIVIALYSVGWAEDIFSFPFQTFIFFISGFTSLIIKFLIDLNYKNLKSLILNLKS